MFFVPAPQFPLLYLAIGFVIITVFNSGIIHLLVGRRQGVRVSYWHALGVASLYSVASLTVDKFFQLLGGVPGFLFGASHAMRFAVLYYMLSRFYKAEWKRTIGVYLALVGLELIFWIIPLLLTLLIV